MKCAVLVLADGSSFALEGRFLLVCETADGTLGIVDYYVNGRERASIVCDSFPEAVEALKQIKIRRRR